MEREYRSAFLLTQIFPLHLYPISDCRVVLFRVVIFYSGKNYTGAHTRCHEKRVPPFIHLEICWVLVRMRGVKLAVYNFSWQK